nr:fimbria/pilus outer membrane usher protein [uncultured Cupriavidus sp.]
MGTNKHLRWLDVPLRFSLRAIALGSTLLAAVPGMSTEIPEASEPTQQRSPAKSQLAGSAQPGIVEFESGFLRAFGQAVDLSRFERDESVTEGDHPVELRVNDTLHGVQTVTFRRRPETGRVEACFAAVWVVRMGLDPEKQRQPVGEHACAFLDQLVDGGSVAHDGGEQTLTVTIPQAFLLYKVRGQVPADALDPGIDGAAFRYNASYTNNLGMRGSSGQYVYGGLQGALNVGQWRFRTYGALTSSAGRPTKWSNVSAYAQRPLPRMQAEAILGDWNTTGTLFDSTPVRGVSLATDDRMLPESLRGYAPVVRGVARSNAVVTIRQGGNVLFEQNVPPGGFEFKDLYATGYGGDLQVSVTESDGQVQRFVVPYASIAQLLRADYTSYSLTLGQIRDNAIHNAPLLMEGTVQHGLTEDVTVYGGAQMTASTYYAAAMGGLAVNTPLGALGMDVTQSFALCVDTARHCDKSGYSVRASLGKHYSRTGTYFSLVGYRYSSPGYYALMDAMRLREVRLGRASVEPLRLRDRFDINVTQSLGQRWGNFFLTGSYGRRWEDNGRALSYQAGYTNSLGRARYNISLGRTRNAAGNSENNIFLSASLPLGRPARTPTPTVGFTASRNRDRTDLRGNLAGNVDELGRASYDTWFDAASGGARAFGATLGYAGEALKGNLTYGHAGDGNSVGANVSGGVVVHGEGVNFTGELGDTIALVQADGAAGARVLPYQRTHIGKDGMALVPYVTPYQWNNLELDLKGSDVGVTVASTRIATAPTAGAMVKVRFDSRRSESAVLRLRLDGGRFVPFGASVTASDGSLIGTVGSGGNLLATNLVNAAVLHARWGPSAAQHCMARHEAQSSSSSSVGRDGVLQVRDVSCDRLAEAAALPAPKERS